MFWLSTRVGLASFDPESGRYTRHTIGELSDAHIFGIHVDKQNDLWLSTEIGLARYNPKTHSFTRFDEKDGIGFAELRSGFFKNARGRLFVGGLDGFAEFDPDSIHTTSHPPEIAVTTFSIFEKELPISTIASGEIHLSHNQNVLSFSFAALDYTDPLRNRFAYRMIGVSNDWIEAGTRNYASYANLNSGTYMFQVRGCNSNNVWNETGSSLAIIIAPPYWQAWWFRLVVAGLILGAMYTAYRYRLKKLLDLERLRLRIANDLHDDVGSNLSAIAMASRTAQRAPELSKTTKKKLAEIYETAVQTSEGMKDLVWFIKPEDDSLDDLLLRMKDTASSLLGETPFDFHSPREQNSATITIDFKRNVFLAFKEIMTNITKHAMASRVEIHVTLHDHVFEMVIHDNGSGFDPNAHHRGNGLQSLQKRAHQIGGSCKITSAPDQGTTVTFSGAM
jgi:signal transduction histidine kinase